MSAGQAIEHQNNQTHRLVPSQVPRAFITDLVAASATGWVVPLQDILW